MGASRSAKAMKLLTAQQPNEEDDLLAVQDKRIWQMRMPFAEKSEGLCEVIEREQEDFAIRFQGRKRIDHLGPVQSNAVRVAAAAPSPSVAWILNNQDSRSTSSHLPTHRSDSQDVRHLQSQVR